MVKNNNGITNTTSSIYTINAVSINDNGDYICRVSNYCGSISSNTAQLTVNNTQLPVITKFPKSDTLCTGKNITFEIAAVSESQLSYQWQVNGTNISGATTTSYTLTNFSKANEGVYKCIVSNKYGSKNASALLLIFTKPIISTAPVTQIKKVGESATYSLTPSGGGPYTYAWYKNNNLISGNSGNIYTISSIILSDAGHYTCLITNDCGSNTAEIGTLIVEDGLQYKASGTITYDNSSNTPITNTLISLINPDLTPLDSIYTDNAGYFTFNKSVKNGVYSLSLKIKKTWGGANATDALLISKYFVKLYTFKDALTLKAADVDNNTKVNSTDALTINKRFVKIIPSFVIGDWLNDINTLIVNGSDVVQNIKVICTGDVNGDYRPLSKKLDSDMSLNNRGNNTRKTRTGIYTSFSNRQRYKSGSYWSCG